MINKLVVIINSLNYKLQLPPEPLTRELPPPDPRSLCPLSSTQFVELLPPPRTKFLGTPLVPLTLFQKAGPQQFLNIFLDTKRISYFETLQFDFRILCFYSCKKYGLSAYTPIQCPHKITIALFKYVNLRVLNRLSDIVRLNGL
jgi:hypothetical protein